MSRRWHRQTTGRTYVTLTGPTHCNGVPIAPVAEIAPRRRRRANPWIERVSEEYRLARHAWELAREDAAMGYLEEGREYAEDYPPPTYRQFLIDLSNPDPEYVDYRFQEATA